MNWEPRPGDRLPGPLPAWLRALGLRGAPDLESIALAQRSTAIAACIFGVPALLCLWLYVIFYQRGNLLLLYLPVPFGLLLLASVIRSLRQPASRFASTVLPWSALIYCLGCLLYRAAFPALFAGDLDLITALLVTLASVGVCLRFTPLRAGLALLALLALLLLHSLPLLTGLAGRKLGGAGLLNGLVGELSLTSLLALLYSSVWTRLALGRSEATSLQMEQLSQTDHLTGLSNRRSLYASIEALMSEVELASRQRDPALPGDKAGAGPEAATPAGQRPAAITTFALALLDIDHFKSVNDTFGHASGDVVLCGVAEVLGMFVRQRDLAGRWGGEEFLMVLPGVPLDRAAVIAERLRRGIESARILPGCSVTASFGVAAWRPGDTPEALIARADAAMYQAKHGGRNRVELSRAAADSAPGPAAEAWHTQPT